MDQITVLYVVNDTVCTDVLLGTMASMQFTTESLRIRLAAPGLILHDRSSKPTPIVIASYKNAQACYFGPVEEKYLDVAKVG